MGKFSERINYVIDNGQYCGHMVNLPILVQADSFDEMKKRLKVLAQMWLKEMTDVVDNDRFEFVEETLEYKS